MSADISDPALVSAVQAVHAKDDPTTWLVAGYAAPGTPKIVLIESGTDPALPPLRRLLDSDAVAKADATFAYASVQGKGMVILRLGNAVNVVKRAKAIVHSRTFAALFPDYLALSTINKTGQFTEELIAEQLGLDPSTVSTASPPGTTKAALPDVSEVTNGDKVEAATPVPAAAPRSESVTQPPTELKPEQPKPIARTPEPTQQPTPAATPPPTGPPPAPPKSAARARSIKRKPSKPAPPAPSDTRTPQPTTPAVPPPSERPQPALAPAPAPVEVSTPAPPAPTSSAPAANPFPTPPVAAVPVVPTPQEAPAVEPHVEKGRGALPQIPTAVRTSLAESSSTASVVNPATPPALATQHERDSMSDEAFQREGLGRTALTVAPPPLLSVSTKDLSDGAPVTPVTTSALTDTTFDSPLPSSLANSPYPNRDWANERRFSRPPSRPLSPDESPAHERPKSMPLSPQPPKDGPLPVQETTVPASGSETFGLVAPQDRPPAQTEIEESAQERTSQKTPTPQPHATDAPHVPSPAKLPETAAEPAPVAARPLPLTDVQRPQPPPPPRRLTPQTAEVLPDGALPSRSSSRNSIPPPLASAARIDGSRLNGSPRIGGPDSSGKLNGTVKQSPFSRLNANSNSLPQPGNSPKPPSTSTSPPMPDVPRALHRSASMSSAGSSQGARSAVSPASVFSPTMPAPPPVPSHGHESAEFLAEPEMHPSKEIKTTGATGVGGVAGMAGVGAAFAARQALAAHTQDNVPVLERPQLAHVPVRRSSRRALNAAFVAQSNEPPSLEATTERPSLESSGRPSVESTRSSLGRSNSLDSASRNRPNVTAGWRSRTPSINSLASAAGSSERKRPLGSRPMRSGSTSTTNTPPMVTSARRVPSPEPVPSAESTTPKPEDKQTNDEVAEDDNAKPAAPVEALSHPVVRQLSLSQSQSTDTSGVATPDSGRSIGHRKTPSGNRKPAPPIDQALIEALKKESVSSDLERLQRSTPTTPLGPPAVSPFVPIEKKEPPARIIPKKVPPPLPLTATMLNVVPPKSAGSSDTAVPKGPLSPGLLSPTTPISPRSPISPVSAASPRHSLSSDFMARMNMPIGNRDSNQSRLSQRMSNRLSQFSARMSRRISSDSGHNHRPYMEDSAGAHDFEQSQASVINAAVARHSTARSVSLSNGRLTPIKTSAPSSSQASQASLPLPSPAMLNGDYRSARDITGPVEGMVIITADTPSRTTTEKGGSSKETSSTSQDKADAKEDKADAKEDKADAKEDKDKAKDEETTIALIEKSDKKENGIKRKAPPAADVVDLNESPQVQQSATLSPPMNTEHFSAVSPQFVNAPRQLSAGNSPSLDTSAALHREQRYPETPQMTSPTITTSPPSSLDRHSSLSQKLRLALRSKSNGEHGAQRPDFLPGSSPIASPPSPTVSNFSNSPNPNRSSIQGSLGRAFRLRAGSSGGHQPMKGTSPGGISSDDFKHLHEKEALHGLGLGMQFPPNSYRTPSGGLGYTPPAKKGRTVSNISAEDALANIRLKNMVEQEEAQERWRRLETERAQNRTSIPLSPTQYDSRVQSLASSTGLSDDEGLTLSPGRISESSERTRSFTEPDVGRPILPRSSLAERPKPHQRLSSRDLGTRESMQSLSSCGSPPRSPVPRSQTRDSIATVFSSESVRSHSDVRESKVSLEPDVRSVISPRSSYERSAKSPERERGLRTSFGQLSERERGSLYRASTFEPRLSRDTMRSTRSNGSRTSFERSARVSRSSFEPPSRMSRDNSFLASPRGLEPLDVNEEPLDEETESERGARLESEAAEEARLEAERAERLAAKKAEAEKREQERLAAQQRAEAERHRLESEKAAQRAEELARRDEQQAEVRRQLVRGHAEGGVMLRGWVTVQGVGTWRRRYFLLLADELKLYKGEGDEKPINTARLGAKTTIDHDVYEESQVRGAWKIRGERGEEFFMFADSEGDRDVVMEGFRIAIGREV